MSKLLKFLVFLLIGIGGVLFIINSSSNDPEATFAILCVAPLWGGLFVSAAIMSLFEKNEKKTIQMARPPKRKW